MAYQKIIHLSDLHLGTENKPEVHRFRKLVSVIGKHYAGVPVLISGDVTDSATKPQMLLARKCIDELARTNLVLVVPGNHDYRALGNFPRRKAPARWTELLGTPFGPGVEPRHWMSAEEEPFGVEGIGVHENDMCVFVGLDSGDPSNKESLARGLITREQSDALAKTLRKHRDKVRVVFLHHHPFSDDVYSALTGTKRLMAALKGNSELLLFGHHHNLGAWWGRNDIPMILASHKSTRLVTGTRMLLSVVEITRMGKDAPKFSHSLKVV